jgi:bifunctional DNA-binding transcriptional regulator/antitoxin component of YhaV-PrlF toxin-antitoxin module
VRLSDDGRLEVPLYVCRELDLKPGQELYFVRTAEGVTLVTKAEMEIFKADEAATNDATPNATPNATTEETP